MTSISRPMCFARDKNGCVYGVNGLERGVRFDVMDKSPTVDVLGVSAPTNAPTITYTTKAPKYYVSGVDVIYGGFNYQTVPTVTFSGADGSSAAAKVELTDGRISNIQMQSYGSGFTGVPTLSCTAPTSTSPYGSGATFGVAGSGSLTSIILENVGSGYTSEPTITITPGGKAATLTATVAGGLVTKVTVTDGGSGYTSAPTVTVTPAPGDPGVGASISTTIDPVTTKVISANVTAEGSGYAVAPTLTCDGGRGTGAYARAEIDPASGRIVSTYILNGGDGYTSTPTISFSAPGSGTTATGKAVLTQTVTEVTITKAGSGYFGAPVLTFFSAKGSGAFAQCETDYDTGAITAVTLQNGGEYQTLPTAKITVPDNLIPAKPKLAPVMKAGILGKYWCAYRFVDATPTSRGGPIPSNLSPLTAVEVTSAADKLVWTCPSTGADSRASKIELWRSTSDQALVLYRVAVLNATSTSDYEDTFGDNELLDPERTISGQKVFDVLPLVLPDGSVNAYRFNPPPQNKSVVVMFQDRAWYAVDNPGRAFDGTTDSSAAGPNTMYFSEIGEPESVPETNELILQTNVRGTDSITALMPAGGGMVIFQNRHAYRMTYASQPILDAGVQLICQRGCLNQRCWDTYDGVAYVVDSMGMYALDGTNAVPISDVVETYWSNGTINFSSSKWFFVRVDAVTRIVRFFFNESGTYPDRALCYHPLTKAWWLEVYAQKFSSSECLVLGGRQRAVVSGESGGIVKLDDGSQDILANGSTQNIDCSFRTGNMALSTEGNSRSVRVLYKTDNPGENTPSYLTLGLHYNGSSTARPAAVATSRGTGFTTDGGANATLNMAANRSLLGDATGYAIASYAGRVDDKSSGGDRHLAIALSTTRTTTNSATIYSAAVEGVSQ